MIIWNQSTIVYTRVWNTMHILCEYLQEFESIDWYLYWLNIMEDKALQLNK